jgi:hypothetical protein
MVLIVTFGHSSSPSIGWVDGAWAFFYTSMSCTESFGIPQLEKWQHMHGDTKSH